MNSEQKVYEHSWSDVQIGGKNSYTAPVTQEKSDRLNWYNSFVSLEGDRRARLRKYDLMDRRSIEVSRSLDIIAEDVSSANADDKDMFEVDYSDEKKIKKTQIKLLSLMIDTWSQRNDFENTLFDHARELFKYGSVFFIKNADGTLKKIAPEKVVGYILSPSDDNKVTHYLVDWNANYLDLKESFKKVQKPTSAVKQQQVLDKIPVEHMVVFKRGLTPFGDSLLERAYPIWRKLDLLETAIVLLRFTRSVDRRVYYIDVGRLPPKKHKEVIDKYRLQMKQKRIVTENGDVDSEFDPHSMTEDYFLPRTSQGRSSAIETLNASSNPGDLVDLTYFARKLAAAMRVPPSFTDTHNENSDREQHSDMRVGQLYQVEMRYLGFINRDKIKMARELFDHYKWFCLERDVLVPEEMELKISEAHNYALYKNIEVYQALANVFQSMSQERTLSKRLQFKKYLDMSEEELIDNEMLVLEEKGIQMEVIKDMPAEHIVNIVYGDGRLGEKYGLPVQEEGGFGGGRF